MAEEQGAFQLADVLDDISAKMIGATPRLRRQTGSGVADVRQTGGY
jgi:hypothetical protein